jgi:hypothetical protein
MLAIHWADFVRTLSTAVARFPEVGSDDGTLDTAAQILEDAKAVVRRRHGALYAPHAPRLLGEGSNSTIYAYGYLRHFMERCFGERELMQAQEAILGRDLHVPGCAL